MNEDKAELNSVDELERNSPTEQNMIYKNEMNMLNSFFSNMNGDDLILNQPKKDKKSGGSINMTHQGNIFCKINDKSSNSFKKKKNKKKKK